MANLPLQDKKQITIWVDYKPRFVRGRSRQIGESVDVTSAVNQLLNEGKIKRIRKYGFGHSGRAGHTYFIANEKHNKA